MFNISKQGSSLLITSNDNSQFPWKDGQMSLPMNSVVYVIDESDYIVFKSAANNDILFTALIDEIQINGTNVTKDDFILTFDNVANSAGGGGGSASAGVNSLNGFQGDLQLKTINGNDIIGSGNIEISGGSVTETDPVFTSWKDDDNVIIGNAAKYDTDGASEEDMQPSIVIGKNASVWGNGIAIGENAYSELGCVSIGKNITSYGIVSIGAENEGNGVIVGKNNKGNGISIGENNNGSGIVIGSGVTENYGGISIGEEIINQTEFGIAIGTRAKNNWENVDNNNSIAIGLNAQNNHQNSIAIGVGANTTGKRELAIGDSVSTDATYTTNINNVIKGDVNKYAFVLNEYGDYVRIPTEWTGTQSQYDSLGTYYDNITYNIIEG